MKPASIGTRVRVSGQPDAPHNRGIIDFLYPCGDRACVILDNDYLCVVRWDWIEPIPEPLKTEVPVALVTTVEFQEAVYRRWASITDGVYTRADATRNELRARGYAVTEGGD